jgi:tRNA modification GTPase
VSGILIGDSDSIVALSSAPGRSAVAIVRLSGPAAFAIASTLVTPWPLHPRRASLSRVIDPADGSTIDRPVVTVFPSPNSYTGEDTVEFSTHGGHAVPEALIRVLLHAGAREATPGEFTKRALLNGKLDLVQAEAIGDLIDAKSDAMRRVVLHQLDGGLSHQIDQLRDRLLDVEALLAYEIDFPEEDHGPLGRSRIRAASDSVLATLDQLLDTAPVATIVREGAIVVIAGRPNVGKSSLFNALVGEVRAIVTDIPGTTRDAIETQVELDGWPVRLIDTAGLRDTDEIVERLGIEVSERYLANAHAIVVCDDDSTHVDATVMTIQSLSTAPVVAVLTKSDRSGITRTSRQNGPTAEAVYVSAHSRLGLQQLATRVRETLEQHYGAIPVDRPVLTRERHRIAIERARQELIDFQQHWEADALPAPIAAVHIRAAVGALDEIIGAVDTEDVLGRLFATFCIGK